MKEVRPYLVVFSALISVLSFPPFPFGILLFISLAIFFYAIEDLPPVSAFKHGFWWGVIFHLGLLYYIAWVTIPGMIATVLIMALIPATASMIWVRLLERNRPLAILFMPSYFLAWNWLMTKSDLNYPWADFGYALAYFPSLIQAAELGGVYLITLFIFVIALLIYLSISERFRLPRETGAAMRYAAVALVIVFYAYGQIRLADLADDRPQGDGVTVGLIQGNIDKDVKWSPAHLQFSFDRYFSLSRAAVRDGAEFLIWPETAIPTYLAQEPDNMAKVKAFIDSINVPVLTGVVYYETVGPREYVYYNSALLIEPHTPDYQLYSKIHLVPMSERIPFSERYRILRDIHLGQADFSSGHEQTILDLGGIKFGTLICFESVFPGYANGFVRKGAQFLVVITNDMWFGRTSLFEQHAMMAVFRAVENRLPVARAANTGISMSIDKKGHILKKTGIFEEDYVITDVHPEESRTVYGKIGDIIPQIGLLVSLLSLAIAFWRRQGYIRP